MARNMDEFEFHLVCDCGNGLEVLATEQTLSDAKRTKQWYIETKDIWPAIIRTRRGRPNGNSMP